MDMDIDPVPTGSDNDNGTGDREYYKSFTVRLALDRDGAVLRTVVVPAFEAAEAGAAGLERNWPGWQPDRLAATLTELAGVGGRGDADPPPEEGPVTVPAEPEPEAAAIEPAAPAPVVLTRRPVAFDGGDADSSPVVALEPAPAVPARQEPERVGEPLAVRLDRVTVVPSVQAGHAPHAGEPFAVRAHLGFDPGSPATGPVDYVAEVRVKNLPGRERLRLGTARGRLALGADTVIEVGGNVVEAGKYRLETLVTLFEPGSERPRGFGNATQRLPLQVV